VKRLLYSLRTDFRVLLRDVFVLPEPGLDLELELDRLLRCNQIIHKRGFFFIGTVLRREKLSFLLSYSLLFVFCLYITKLGSTISLYFVSRLKISASSCWIS
jgi:hypothetical protein